MAKKDVPGLACRLAGPEDAEALAAMIADFAAYERMASQASAETLRNELSRPDRVLEAVLATLDGKPVGMAAFFQSFSTFIARRGIYLEDIYVKEDCRNKGIATAMLKHIAQIARERDIGRVEFTVLLWNNVAIEFFETLGATPNSAWTTYRLSGDWLKKLASE